MKLTAFKTKIVYVYISCFLRRGWGRNEQDFSLFNENDIFRIAIRRLSVPPARRMPRRSRTSRPSRSRSVTRRIGSAARSVAVGRIFIIFAFFFADFILMLLLLLLLLLLLSRVVHHFDCVLFLFSGRVSNRFTFAQTNRHLTAVVV